MERDKSEIAVNTDATLAAAGALLAKRGSNFTVIRRAIFELLCRESKAISAYTLVSAMAKKSGRRIAPQTVYRALDFLVEQGLVAHLPNARAYVARSPDGDEVTLLYFVCSACGLTVECHDPYLERSVRLSADAVEFVARACVIDLAGLCKQCSQTSTDTENRRRAIAIAS